MNLDSKERFVVFDIGFKPVLNRVLSCNTDSLQEFLCLSCHMFAESGLLKRCVKISKNEESHVSEGSSHKHLSDTKT